MDGWTEPGPDDVLILELRLDRGVLSSGVVGYLRRGEVLLPLGEVTRALDLAISVDPGAGTASGWFLQENRRFSLALERREVLVEGRRGELNPEQVEVRPEDIYVDSSLFSRWFPVEIEIDLSRLVVNIKPREKLPIQQQLERKALWRQLRRQATTASRDYPAVELPYRLLGWPSLDGTLTLSSLPDEHGRARLSLKHQALFTGDLLFMTGELFLNSGGSRYAPDESPRLQLLLSRKSAEASLLGPLHAREVGLGVVVGPERPLIAASRTGRGLVISSYPIDSLEEYDRITLRGSALPGWEAELYRNGMLFDFQTIEADGRYSFSGVPLLFGVNLFRLVFYGPQGQRREEVRRYVIGDGLVRRGESHYRFAFSSPEPEAKLAQVEQEQKQEETARSSFEFERGFAHGVAAALSLDSLTFRDARHTYGAFSLRSRGSGAFARLDLAMEDTGGWATRMEVQTRFDDLGITARHDQYQGFVSEEVQAALDSVHSRSELRLDGSFQKSLPHPLSYSLALDQERRSSGVTGTLISARIAGGPPTFLISNLLSLQVQESDGRGGGTRAPELKGSLLVNARHGGASLRGQAGYRLQPRVALSDVSLQQEWNFGRERRLRLGVRRSVLPPASDRLLAGVSWGFKDFLMGADLAYETHQHGGFSSAAEGSFGGHGLSIGLTLSYSLYREPLAKTWQMSSRRIAEAGSAAARVFLDRDLDGHFGPGDEPLAGVRFSTEESSLHGVTDDQGSIRLGDLPLYRPVGVAIKVGSLDDPYWVPAREGVRFIPRPGTAPVLDFPVVTSGEVEGTVALSKNGRTTQIANVRLQLLTSDGRVEREARSEYDGFYLFERVPPGQYKLRLEPEQLGRLGLVPPQERTVEIGPEGELVRGVDFLLEATFSH